MNLFSVGYEGLNFDEFMPLLSKHGIETVVDIRELPLSRKPGFSKKALANALNLTGVNLCPHDQTGLP
jgi:uncharacterized protein (DUF488 family)